MRVLLDECLPRKLKKALTGHEVKTVAESGWAGRKNGDLLRLAQERFDVFITVDRNLAFQQDVGQFDIAVVVLAAYRNACWFPSSGLGTRSGSSSFQEGLIEVMRV